MSQIFDNTNEALELDYELALEGIKENNFCKVFFTAKPLLKVFANFFLIPKKWRIVIEGLITVSEQFCENKI